MRHKLSRPTIGGLLVALCFQLQARPLDAIGHCAPNADMNLATGAFEGLAPVLWSNPLFVRAQQLHTNGQPQWLAKLSGVSGKNRVLSDGRRKIIVLTVCDPTNCEGARAYIGFDPSSNAWGASVYLDAQVMELGDPIMPGSETQVVPATVSRAIICGQNLDWGGGR